MNYILIAKIIGPIAILAVVYLIGRDDGSSAVRAKIEAKLEKQRDAEWIRYFEREKIAQDSYEKALQLVAGAQGAKPQIIERIANAAQTECSLKPVGPDRVRLLNSAIAGGWTANPAAGAAPHREAWGFTPLAGGRVK
jgi:hypothetical protein